MWRLGRRTHHAPVEIRFSGALELLPGRDGHAAVVYANASEALAAGLSRSIVDRLFPPKPPPPAPARPACETVGEPRRGGIWVTCRSVDCPSDTGGGCTLYSWPRDAPGDEQDEGSGGWALPGRVYQCRCVYSD
jgi:hypothetical protein